MIIFNVPFNQLVSIISIQQGQMIPQNNTNNMANMINNRIIAYSFDAADSPSSILLDENECIKAATLEKLIEKLTTYQYSSMLLLIIILNFT